ncbi:MAG: hypothetical protein CMH93_06430, partial [Oceanicaulis sp.]|nr:hypothetical protein [Oceanicaulis sp.]
MGRFLLAILLAVLPGVATAASDDEPVIASEIPEEPQPVRTADLDRWALQVTGWTPQSVAELAGFLYEAPGHGLPALDGIADYLLDPDVAFEPRAAAASRAALQYTAWLEYGLIDQDTLTLRLLTDNEASRLVARLVTALDTGHIEQAITESLPAVRDYDILRREMLRLMTLRPIWPQIGGGDTLTLGDAGVRVDQLRARLAAEGLLAPGWASGDAFDMRLETALRRYQGRVNLSPTGRLDRPTLRQLNITPEERIAQLRANLEQRRWRTRQLGERHIWVNLADFHLEAWENGRLAREHE